MNKRQKRKTIQVKNRQQEANQEPLTTRRGLNNLMQNLQNIKYFIHKLFIQVPEMSQGNFLRIKIPVNNKRTIFIHRKHKEV